MTHTPEDDTPLSTRPGRIAADIAAHMLENPEKFLQQQRSELLAKTFRHFIKVKEEEVALETIVAAVSNSIRDIKDGDTDELETMLAEQAMILHGTFHFYLDQSKGAYTDITKVATALKAQRQYERTVRAMSRLREQKIKELEREEKKFGKRTHNSLDSCPPRARHAEFFPLPEIPEDERI